uniref:Uncharacterized protein n=1 Tax=Cryptomonas curvata TaxID=233186 RepID=A0A7S0QRK1_9CRYP
MADTLALGMSRGGRRSNDALGMFGGAAVDHGYVVRDELEFNCDDDGWIRAPGLRGSALEFSRFKFSIHVHFGWCWAFFPRPFAQFSWGRRCAKKARFHHLAVEF